MLNDIRYALRTMRQNPGFTLTAILSIALGIGVNSTIFSLANGLLLRPLPVPKPSQVFSLRSLTPRVFSSGGLAGAGRFADLSYRDYVDFRDKNQSFSGLVAYAPEQVGFAPNTSTQPRLEGGLLVSANFFSVLGIEPQLGRGFTSEEDQVPGRDTVVVLGYEFWNREFASAPSVIGRQIRLDGLEFTVIGVASRPFTFQQVLRPAFFIPVMMGPSLHATNGDLLTNRERRTFMVKGRLKPGVSLEAANNEAQALAKSFEESYPETNHAIGAAVRTETQTMVDAFPFYPAILASLFFIVMAALSIACANVANLMLGRGRARAREIAVRMAIGASRARVVRQLLVESLLIAVGGGALGLLMTEFAVDAFYNVEIPADLPLQFSFQMDQSVVWFTLVVSAASAVLFGLLPAIRSTKPDLVRTMKLGESDERGKRFSGRNALVIMQIAGSLLLLVAATQRYRSNADAIAANPGYRTDHRIIMRLDPALAGYSRQQTEQFYKTLIDRSREVPGVKSAALSFYIPLSYNFHPVSVVPEGYKFAAGQESVLVPTTSVVDTNYFETFGVPLVAGRGFLPADRSDSPRVAVVNETFARRYLGENPVGKRMRLDGKNAPWMEVVGVAAPGKYYGILEPPMDFIYFPLSQNPESRMTLIVESYMDPASLAAPLREMVRSIDANVPIVGVRTMENLFEQSGVKQLQITSKITGLAAAIGLGLALFGLYAVVAYQVSRKTREIGIRVALGADQRHVMKMILRQAAKLSLTGIGIGLVLSLAASLAFASAANPRAPFDPVALILASVGLLLTALLAAAVPARRASRVDPMQALRQE
ncbi:MAG TPA: ABC transporter permease [Terriglobia bacterium]|nr:ABC transporter permease [Terriglobia bacterium]